VAVVHALVVTFALVALACLPCAVALFITSADEYVERMGRALRRGYRRTRRALCKHRGFRWLAPRVPVAPVGPPIEQIAADLRRLGRQRLGIATRSTVWFTAIQRAYDDRLRLACRSLDIEQHLDELAGLDLDIERVRVEGELLGAGVALGSVDVDHR
jgi:hypothetical protein